MKKLKDKKNGKKPLENKEILYLFYMTEKEIGAKEIADSLSDIESISVELWESMNIIQIDIDGNDEIDFEYFDEGFHDEADVSFIKSRNINTVFMITCEKDVFNRSSYIFKKLINAHKGFVCTDSDDFKPVYGIEQLD